MAEAGPKFVAEAEGLAADRGAAAGKEIKASWQGTVNGTAVMVQSTVRLWQKSLVVDCICTGGLATELSYGRIENVETPELLLLPYMNYGGHHLNVLMSKGKTPYFASVWMDWYRSNASEPRAWTGSRETRSNSTAACITCRRPTAGATTSSSGSS